MNEATDAMHRAVQLAKFNTSRNKRPTNVAGAFERLYAAAGAHKEIWHFVELADLAIDYGLRSPLAAAQELETLAATIPLGTYSMAVKRAWDLAARLHEKLSDPIGRQRCLKAAVDQTLAMRGEVNGSPGAEAAWITDALQQLRHVDGEEAKVASLEIEIRRLQQLQLKEMREFKTDLELDGVPEQVTESYGTLSLSDALKKFALITHSRDPAVLRANALKTRETAPLMAMMAAVHLDAVGRQKAKSAGAPHDGDPDDAWFSHHIGQLENMHRVRAVRGWIHPARLAIKC